MVQMAATCSWWQVRLRVGIYHVYLAEWLKVFPRDQILVIRLEDYAKNLKQTTRRVYDFLGLRELMAFTYIVTCMSYHV